MTQITKLAHSLVRSVLRPGDIAIDATVGNGHDTLVLAECVAHRAGGTFSDMESGIAGQLHSTSKTGIVYGLDIQSKALESARQRIMVAGVQNVILLQRNHAELDSIAHEFGITNVRAIMFNLGYLPGSDKRLTTRIETTMAALKSSFRLVQPGGIVTVLAYVGHPGGREEAAAIELSFKELPADVYEVNRMDSEYLKQDSPRLFAARRRE